MRWGGCKQELGAPRAPHERYSYPCPQLLQVQGETGRQTHTRTHAHTLSESGSSISPPSALLNPIVQTRDREPRELGLLPLASPNPSLLCPPEARRLGPSLRPSCPFLTQPPSLWAFTSSACDPFWGGRGRGLARNNPRDPSCHLLGLGRNCRYSRATSSSITDFCKGAGPGPIPHFFPLKC